MLLATAFVHLLPTAFTSLTDPKEYEADTRKLLPEWQKNFTSDDYTDYTWHAPTVRVFTGRPVLRTPYHGYEYPNWAYNAIRAIGNYGELYERTMGERTPVGLPRAQNNLWTNGGLMYALPLR